MLKERRGVTGLLPVLHHVPQLAADQFPAQLQQLSDINIDLNAVRLALAARFTEIILYPMCLRQVKRLRGFTYLHTLLQCLIFSRRFPFLE